MNWQFGLPILNDKKRGVKLKENIIVKSKLTDWEKIFADVRNMKQLVRRNLQRERERVAELEWDIDKLVPLPMRIWSCPEYSSEEIFRFCRLLVRWWVAPVSRYQFSSVGRLGEE